MAGRLYSVEFSGFSVAASSTKSCWLLDPVADGFTIVEFSVSGNLGALSVPVQVDLYIATTLGSPTGTSTTPYALNPLSVGITADTTALTALTAEPTTKQLIASWYAQPIDKMIDKQYPLQREITQLGAGLRVGLQVVTPSGVAPTLVGHVWIAE